MVSFGMFRINEIEYKTKEEAVKNLIKSRDRIHFNCERCGVEYSVEKRRFDCFYCDKCKRIIKSLEKYGVENPTQAKEVIEKRKQTNLEKYGGVAPACSKDTIKKMKQTNLQKYGSVAPMGNEEIKEKSKQTNLKKYGVENAASSPEIQEKKKQNSSIKYGVEYHIASDEVKNKIRKTNLERYGFENSLYNKNIQEKIKKTNLERYGFESPYSNKEVQNKIRKTHLERFGNICSLVNTEIHRKSVITLLEKYGVDNPIKCIEINKIIALKNKTNNYNKLKNRLFDSFEVITSLEDYLKGNHKEKPIVIKCKKCNEEFDFLVIDGDEPRCPACSGTPVGGSFKEDEVADFIASIYNGAIERNKRIYLDNKYEIDIYLPELKIGFEYDGIKWHTENFGMKDRNYHLDKQNLASEKGIQLFFIRSDEWAFKKKIVKSIISSKLGVFSNRYYARKCFVKEIKNKIANDFLIENHIQGISLASVKIGLFFNDELVSVATFGKSRFNKKYEWELLRYANKINTSVIGGFSKMLSYFRKNYNPTSIITYSDKRYFNKDTYISSGFSFIGNSKPNYIYTKENDVIGSRIQFQKHKLKSKLEIFNEDFTEWQNMLINNYDRIWDCGNRVFVLGGVN